MIPNRNENLIIESINDNFFVVVNPCISDGLKVINKRQIQVLHCIDNVKTVEQIANLNGISVSMVVKFLNILKSKKMVNYTGEFAPPSWGQSPKTLGLWIHTTDACNLNCPYCYVKTKKTKRHFDDTLMDRLSIKILETVKNRNLRQVSLRLAGGEPLLRFNSWNSYLTELEQSLNDVECDLKVSFLTNLTLLDETIINYLKKHKFVYIGVSLDGLDNYHDITRSFKNGDGSFRQVSENIERLLNAGILPSIMTTVSEYNMEGLLRFTEYLIEKRLPFRFSIVHGQSIDRRRLSEILHCVYDKFDRAIELGYPFSKLHHLCELKFVNISFQTCRNGFSGGTLYVDGNITFCQKLFGVEEGIGSIREDIDLIDILQRGKIFLDDLSDECNTCKYRYICTGGCPLERCNGKAPDCEIYKEFIPKIYRLMGKEKLLKIQKIWAGK